jgi:uncharacterized metal-binding protein YceD (DUF177 family)
VKSNHQFVILFRGLSLGKHDFTFDVDNNFFNDFEESEINKGKVLVSVRLNKTANLLELDFNLSGNVVVTCDRCLDEFEMTVKYQTKLFVKFGEISEEEDDEIIILSHADGELDIKQYIYEYIHLSLPYKRVHPDKQGQSTCNKEMLKKLNEYTIREPKVSPLNDLKNIMNKN